MENAYGIGVTNRYQLFLDNEDDPLEVLKVQEQEKEAKKKTKLSEKENKGKPDAKGKVPPIARKGIKETQNLKSQDVPKPKEDFNKAKSARPTGDRVVKYNNENREERNNRKNREDKPVGEYHSREERGENRYERRDREVRSGDSRGENKEFRSGEGGDNRGRGRGLSSRGLNRGRGRGGRGGYDGRGKREFDRQSGSDKTGIKPVNKREGGGAHNWGSHRDVFEEVNNSTQQSAADDSGDWSNEKPEPENPTVEPSEQKDPEIVGTGPENEETTPNVEEEQKEMTLDEYRALKGARQKPQYNLRKAGEGEDPSQWKKMYALQKKKEGDEEDDEEEEYDSSDYPQRVGRQKHWLGIEIHFADNVRSAGRGRGGRGMGRGGPRGGLTRTGPIPSGMPDRAQGPPIRERDRDRDRERERDTRTSRQSAPKVDDEHDFPSLG